MFENFTYENILSDVLARAPDEIDSREGSIFYDAVSAVTVKIAELYTQLEMLYANVNLSTAEGEALDLKGDERLVKRKEATCAEYEVKYTGTLPDTGSVFYTENGLYFTLMQYDDGVYYLQSNDTGTILNGLENEKVIPVETFMDLNSISLGKLYIPAMDLESDDEYRQRIYDSMTPGENGNKQHYIMWCNSVTGVGYTRILPLKEGANTVVGIIIASDGTAASEELLKKVQDYVDPDLDGDGIGDGLGEGVANLGAHFIAKAPTIEPIDVYINLVTYSSGYTKDTALPLVKETVADYFREAVVSGVSGDSIVLNSSAIASNIQQLGCIENFGPLSFDEDEYRRVFTDDIIPSLRDVILQ